jgi:hypothetical protein
LLTACPAKTEPDASVLVPEDAAMELPDAGLSEPVDAGPPQPADLALVVTAAARDGGVEVVEHEIDPVKSLDVWIPVVLSDYRLRVFDETDRVVPSDDAASEIDGGIDYRVGFVEPLKSGRNYRLTVEAQLGAQLEGYKDAEVLMKVRGPIEPDGAKKPDKKRKRH